jgi:hypothetical protein
MCPDFSLQTTLSHYAGHSTSTLKYLVDSIHTPVSVIGISEEMLCAFSLLPPYPEGIRLTPELTGRQSTEPAFKLSDERQAIAAPVE